MFPPEKKMCHRTGFTKSCFELVSTKQCDRWGKLTTEDEHGTAKDNFMCIDDMEVGLLAHFQKLLNQVVGSVDALREESKQRDVKHLALSTAAIGAALIEKHEQLALVGGSTKLLSQ